MKKKNLQTSRQNREQYNQQQRGQGPAFQVFAPDQEQWPVISRRKKLHRKDRKKRINMNANKIIKEFIKYCNCILRKKKYS